METNIQNLKKNVALKRRKCLKTKQIQAWSLFYYRSFRYVKFLKGEKNFLVSLVSCWFLRLSVSFFFSRLFHWSLWSLISIWHAQFHEHATFRWATKLNSWFKAIQNKNNPKKKRRKNRLNSSPDREIQLTRAIIYRAHCSEIAMTVFGCRPIQVKEKSWRKNVYNGDFAHTEKLTHIK